MDALLLEAVENFGSFFKNFVRYFNETTKQATPTTFYSLTNLNDYTCFFVLSIKFKKANLLDYIGCRVKMN